MSNNDDLAIKVDHVYKEYRLGTIGGATLKGEIQSKIAKLRHKEDPNLKIGEKTHDKNKRFLALNDLSFEIKKGETVGIIGQNGAGKSTILKLICRVTAPSKGDIYMNGRLTSMLEVGTGFHQELTGRENVYLNGAILGMTKQEIDEKFDEIVDFSEVGQFIDTPVKRYSSGMKVKLGFSVASHLNSEIMIMDEVLAVGDVNFQNKCISRMRKVAEEDGKTILYVSHNMATVKKLCDRCIVLAHGTKVFEGKVDDAIAVYLKEENQVGLFFDVSGEKRNSKCNMRHVVQSVEIMNSKNAHYDYGKTVKFQMTWHSMNDYERVKMKVVISANDVESVGLSFCNDLKHISGENTTDFELDTKYLIPGRYVLYFKLYDEDENGNVVYYDQCKGMVFVIDPCENSIHLNHWFSDWGHAVLPCIIKKESS